MCARVSLSKLFAPSFRKSEATGFGRNRGLRLNPREQKECLNPREPEECGSAITFSGYPVNPAIASVQTQILKALHSGERGKASTLLSRIGENKPLLRPNHFVKVLEYCALTPDPLFVMEIWETMEEKGIDMNNKCHVLMIQALCKGGHIDEAFNLMNNCGETPDLYPTVRKYNTLLGASANIRSVTHASKCLDLMENDLIGKNEVTYIELLKLAVSQENLEAVHSIWKEYAQFYNFNVISLRKFIWSFTELGDIESALEALKYLVDLVFRGDFNLKKSFEEKMIDPKLDIPIPFYSNLECSNLKNVNISSKYEINMDDQIGLVGFDLKNVKRVGALLKKPKNIAVMRMLRFSFTDIILACRKAKNYKLAEQLFLQMQNLGIEPSILTYDGLIRVIVQQKGFDEGMKVLKLMKQKYFRPLDTTLEALSVCCSRELKLDLAEKYLDQMALCSSVFSYNKLLEACETMDELERGVRVFGKMKQREIKPDITTYELLFSLFGNVNAPYENGNILSQAEAAKRINAIEDDMVRNGIQHNYVSIRNLLRALGSEGMISGLLHYLSVAENKFTPGYPIYNIVLHSLVEAKEGEMAINVFKTLLSHGYHPNDVTCNIMIDCCASTGSFKSAQGLIAMMIRNGYPPQTQTYTALVKLVLALDDFKEALILLNQACSEGIRLDALLFNTILNNANYKERIDVIEYVMDRMHKEGVKPDPNTCGYVFSAYVNRGFHTTAMEALQVMSINMLSEEDIDEKITYFEENFIYAEDSEAESRAVDLFKDSKEYIAIALLNLRWCAMAGNPISWSTDQSQWVKRLSATYTYSFR